MRQLLFILGSFLVITTSSAQSMADQLIKFSDSVHSFGKVPKGKPVTYEFNFINPGKKPLVIEDATAECGCTKPEFPTQAILGGKAGKIRVTYDAKEGGTFNKKVTIKLVNVAETKVLTISGEVI